MIEIYTDGSYRAKTKKGAFGFCAVFENIIYDEIYGESGDTTNNRMELKAMLHALEYLHDKQEMFQNHEVIIYSDSEYLVKSMTEWWPGWVKNNFKTSTNKPIANLELFKSIMKLYSQFSNVTIKWVKGHADNTYNNLIDEKVQALTKKPLN
jgi:ribonuclease HI